MTGVCEWAEEKNSVHSGKWNHKKNASLKAHEEGKKEKLLVSENLYTEEWIALLMQ